MQRKKEAESNRKISKNFCETIRCDRANDMYLCDTYKCIEKTNGKHVSRCTYFDTNGEIDLQHMEGFVKGHPDFNERYRTEFQIVTALIVIKRRENEENTIL